MATLTVRVEAATAVDEVEATRLSGLAQHQIKSMVGVTAGVEVVGPGQVPRSEGKAQRVV